MDNGPRETASGGESKPLRVMQSFRQGGTNTNPYLVQLARSISVDARVIGFSWRTALCGDYDVFHAHWPEVLLRGTTWWKTAARRVLFAMLLVRIRNRRVALVRTLHNTAAHESGSRIERWLLNQCDLRTTLWIRLNPTTLRPGSAPVETILHGDYRGWFAHEDLRQPVRGRLLFFGLVRPYKGVPGLISAFRELDAATSTSLRIVGKPNSASLEDQIREVAGKDPRVQLVLDYVSDRRLAVEVSEAEMVVLPYDDMHNSGALLLALSLNRPVLVPSNAVTEALRLEAGEGWVRTYEGPLTTELLAKGLSVSRTDPPADGPDLSHRSWSEIGAAHLSAYRTAVQLAGRMS